MGFIKKTLSVSIKHLSKTTTDALRKSEAAKDSNGNEFFIKTDDKYFSNWGSLNDLQAIIYFAQCVECDSIHIHKAGEVVPCLMQYVHHPREVDGKDATLELAYYGGGLVYQKMV